MTMLNGKISPIKNTNGEVSMKKNTLKLHNTGWKRRISLVLIFTMLFSTFMYQGWYKPKKAAAAAVANGTMYYSNNATTPVYRAYTASTNLFGAQGNTTLGAAQGFMQIKSSPVDYTKVAGYTTAAGQLYIENFNGTTWSAGFNVAVGAVTGSQMRFDIAYEQASASGRAVVVYTKNVAGANNLAYRVWNGASWSTETTFTAARLTRAVQWVKMASRRGSNEIAVAVADLGSAVNTATLTTLIWDGSIWGNEPAAAHSATLYSVITTGIIQSDEFDLAYESLSGELLVVWIQATTAGEYYRTYSAGTWGSATSFNTRTGGPASIMAKPNPETNDILVLHERSASTVIYGYVWSGSGMATAGTCGAVIAPVADQRQFTGGWVKFNTTWYALAVFNKGATATIGYNYWNGTTWGTATTTASVATTAKYWFQSDDDTKGNDSMLVAFSDSASDLFTKRVQVTAATPTFTWTATVSPDAALTATLASITSQNFAFTYDDKDITAPTTSGLTFDSPVYNTFVGSPFTFHGTLTDLDSAVTQCEVCVKNGAECTSTDTWVPGAISGTGPYTCTASNVTTYSNGGAITSGNNVYVDVRGTSVGGTNSNGGTAVFKTMDKTGPTDGTLSLTPGVDQNLISWTTATDAQSGVASYDVRYLPGTTAPADCNSGTSAYTGTGLSYTHIVTPYAGGYSYRVCAVDNVAIKSAGLTRTGLPTWSSTVTCGRCHGDATSFPDGTNRNNPEGTFVGSHDAHAVNAQTPCSTCHINPTTTNHRNGSIEMQATINGGTYSKASPITQVNNLGAPSTGSCSNISCHGANNPTPQWGVGTVGCVDCHAGTITRTKGVPGGTLAAITGASGEFGLAWGHKNSKRGPVASADCIVCHLEGNFATQRTSAKHGDGYIDLRDPDGTGETPITDLAGAAFTFTKYSISYGATSRSSTPPNTDIAYVITKKFCMACHDSNGANNPMARSNNGGAGSAEMPFGGIGLGANYTALNGAIGTQGLVDVATQFLSTNSSRHPVGAPNSRRYPYSTRLAVPYNNIGTTRDSNTMANNTASPRVAANSVVMVCDDCHTTGTSLTNRTITAHGNNASLRGTYFITSATQMCMDCHIGAGTSLYPNTGSTEQHGTGSGFQSAGADANRPGPAMATCNFCHFSNPNVYNAANRPRYAQDIHGFNEIYGSVPSTGTGWAAGDGAGIRPIAFLRNAYVAGATLQGSWPTGFSPRPYAATGITTGQASCGGATASFAFNGGNSGITACSSQGHYAYQPGGSY